MSVPPPSPIPAEARALARFPAEIRSAHTCFVATGDLQAADDVLLAVVRDHLPKSSKAQPDTPLPDESRLIEDLGFDSLAVAEVVFFIEDLYQVRIPQRELLELRRIGDLRAYLRARLKAPQA